MIVLQNKLFLLSFLFISLYSCLVFWLLFNNKNHLLHPRKQCHSFFTYKGLYKIDENHLKQKAFFNSIEEHNIDFILLRSNTIKSMFSKYYNHTLVISPPTKDNFTSIVDLNHIWSDKFKYNKLHIFWTLLTYPFAPQTAFLYLLQHSTSISTQTSFLNSPSTTLASFNIKPNNFLKNFQIPTYNQLFHLVKNYVFTKQELIGQANPDTQILQRAIQNAQSFVGFDFLGSTENFCSFIQEKNGLNTKVKTIGSQSYLSKNKKLFLYVGLPQKPQFPYQVKIYKNKKLFLTYSELKRHIPISQEGRYKILVEVKPPLPKPFNTHWTPWIITNSFFIKK